VRIKQISDEAIAEAEAHLLAIFGPEPRHHTPKPRAPVTYAEIARELGLTPQGVCVIERRALEKIRRNLEAQGLTLADFIDSVD